jgi:hypothetical protein
MKPLYLIAASALALTASACGPKVPAARAALECPPNEGDLTPTSVSPDGKACTYVTSGGAEVTLQLVPVKGSVDATLAGIETNLLANRVKPTETAAKPEEGAKPAKDVEKAARDDLQKDVDRTVAEATADANASGVKVEVGKHGTTVVTEDGGKTTVNLPGIHIVANDDDESAKVQVGPLHINANGEGGPATLNMRQNVRLRGEALNPEKRGFRAMFLYKGDDLPDGYRWTGYYAGGPRVGPFTIAVAKSKAEDIDGDDIYSDVKRLVRRNGGV